MSKQYELSLHWKQGDDLAGHIESEATISDALRKWGEVFRRNQEICKQIAKVLEGKKVLVIADTHFIGFEPKNKEAEQALAALAKEELLTVIEAEEVE